VNRRTTVLGLPAVRCTWGSDGPQVALNLVTDVIIVTVKLAPRLIGAPDAHG